MVALELPPSKDWQEINIHRKLLRIVAMVSGFVFVGPELSRTEPYIDAAVNYTTDVINAQRAVQKIRPWLRPLLTRGLPELESVDRRIREADAFMRPVIQHRKDATKRAIEKNDESEKPDDMLQWLIDALPKYRDRNSQDLARVQLGLSFAAIHTTTLSATNT